VVAQGGEWFLAGTAPALPATAPASAFGISSPRDGSLFVLDPDIPMAAQRLVFEGAPGRWSLDGQHLGAGPRVRWLPRPGRHVLQWQGADAGDAVRVAFEVRASAPPPARTTGSSR